MACRKIDCSKCTKRRIWEETRERENRGKGRKLLQAGNRRKTGTKPKSADWWGRVDRDMI